MLAAASDDPRQHEVPNVDDGIGVRLRRRNALRRNESGVSDTGLKHERIICRQRSAKESSKSRRVGTNIFDSNRMGSVKSERKAQEKDDDKGDYEEDSKEESESEGGGGSGADNDWEGSEVHEDADNHMNFAFTHQEWDTLAKRCATVADKLKTLAHGTPRQRKKRDDYWTIQVVEPVKEHLKKMPSYTALGLDVDQRFGPNSVRNIRMWYKSQRAQESVRRKKEAAFKQNDMRKLSLTRKQVLRKKMFQDHVLCRTPLYRMSAPELNRNIPSTSTSEKEAQAEGSDEVFHDKKFVDVSNGYVDIHTADHYTTVEHDGNIDERQGRFSADQLAAESCAVEAPAVQPPAVETPATEPVAVEAPAVQSPAVETPVAQPTAAEMPTAQSTVFEIPTPTMPTAVPSVAPPPVAQPPAAKPSVAQNPIAHPSIIQPPTMQPEALSISAAQPPSLQLPSVQQTTDQPRADEPLTTQPPSAQHPTVQPPATQPSVVHTPVSQLRTAQSSAAQSFATQLVVDGHSAGQPPITGQPSAQKPTAQPFVTQLPFAHPPAVELPVTQPAPAERPFAVQQFVAHLHIGPSSGAQPSPTQLPEAHLPMARHHTVQQSVGQSPVARPLTIQPPAVDPLAVHLPAAEQPTSQHPATQQHTAHSSAIANSAAAIHSSASLPTAQWPAAQSSVTQLPAEQPSTTQVPNAEEPATHGSADQLFAAQQLSCQLRAAPQSYVRQMFPQSPAAKQYALSGSGAKQPALELSCAQQGSTQQPTVAQPCAHLTAVERPSDQFSDEQLPIVDISAQKCFSRYPPPRTQTVQQPFVQHLRAHQIAHQHTFLRESIPQQPAAREHSHSQLAVREHASIQQRSGANGLGLAAGCIGSKASERYEDAVNTRRGKAGKRELSSVQQGVSRQATTHEFNNFGNDHQHPFVSRNGKNKRDYSSGGQYSARQQAHVKKVECGAKETGSINNDAIITIEDSDEDTSKTTKGKGKKREHSPPRQASAQLLYSKQARQDALRSSATDPRVSSCRYRQRDATKQPVSVSLCQETGAASAGRGASTVARDPTIIGGISDPNEPVDEKLSPAASRRAGGSSISLKAAKAGDRSLCEEQAGFIQVLEKPEDAGQDITVKQEGPARERVNSGISGISGTSSESTVPKRLEILAASAPKLLDISGDQRKLEERKMAHDLLLTMISLHEKGIRKFSKEEMDAQLELCRPGALIP